MCLQHCCFIATHSLSSTCKLADCLCNDPHKDTKGKKCPADRQTDRQTDLQSISRQKARHQPVCKNQMP